MAIKINLDFVLLKNKMKLVELSKLVGISVQNLSVLKNGHAKAIKVSTLNKLCKHLKCKPGELLDYEEIEGEEDEDESGI